MLNILLIAHPSILSRVRFIDLIIITVIANRQFRVKATQLRQWDIVHERHDR